MREGLGGSDGQMRVGVKGREEQDDRSRMQCDSLVEQVTWLGQRSRDEMRKQ